ncbi:12169_t:CDS:2, partial [Gigaspora margarita]
VNNGVLAITSVKNHFVSFTIFTFTDAKTVPNLYIPRIATLFALLSGANIDVLLILKSYLMELELFNAPLSENALKAVFWGSCADTALQDTPQFIIQKYSPYLISHYDHHAVESSPDDQKSNTDFDDDDSYT